jgi:hypothetical protein
MSVRRESAPVLLIESLVLKALSSHEYDAIIVST